MVSYHAPHISDISVHKDSRIIKCASEALTHSRKIKKRRGEFTSLLGSRKQWRGGGKGMNDLVDLLEKKGVLLLSGLKDSIAQVVNENISKCEVVFKGFFSCMCPMCS